MKYEGDMSDRSRVVDYRWVHFTLVFRSSVGMPNVFLDWNRTLPFTGALTNSIHIFYVIQAIIYRDIDTTYILNNMHQISVFFQNQGIVGH